MLERQFWYGAKFTIGAGLTIYDQRIPIRQNAPFLLRGMGAQVTSGAIAARYKRADGSWLTGNQFSHMSGLMHTGRVARPTAIVPQVLYPPESAFVMDFQDLGGAGDTGIFPVLWGCERYQDGQIPNPAVPARYIEQPDTVSVPIVIDSSAAEQMQLDLPIRCKPGDAFAIRQLTWNLNGEGSSGPPITLSVRIRDEYGRPFMNDWIPMRSIFGGDENYLGSVTPYPSTVYPQMVIPANGSFNIDIWTRADVASMNFQLAFGGVRLVAVGEPPQ